MVNRLQLSNMNLLLPILSELGQSCMTIHTLDPMHKNEHKKTQDGLFVFQTGIVPNIRGVCTFTEAADNGRRKQRGPTSTQK